MASCLDQNQRQGGEEQSTISTAAHPELLEALKRKDQWALTLEEQLPSNINLG